jgi:hypothetical protein
MHGITMKQSVSIGRATVVVSADIFDALGSKDGVGKDTSHGNENFLTVKL